MFWRRTRNDRHERPGRSAVGKAVATIDDGTFFTSTEGGFTVVDFWAPWCGPCRAFGPVFDDVAARFGERVRFARCNVDESPATVALLQVTAVPTVIAFDPNGSELGRIVGVPRRSDLADAAAELERRSQA